MKLSRALCALLVAVACSKSPPATPVPSASPVVVVTPDAQVPIVDAPPDAAAKLIGTTQLVTAIVPDWTSTAAELRLWTHDPSTGWKLALGPWPGVVGVNGTAWGTGVHGTGAPAGRTGPVKQEGDGKSPAGIFEVRKAYGYAKSAKAGLPYQPVTADWKCIDDGKSASYTQIVDKKTVAVDWSSAEDMRRKDELYTWVIDLAHNTAASPGAGSCIFLHVWRGPESGTAGCTAMDESKVAKLVEVLTPGAMYVLLPRADYDALAPSWGLPP